MTSQASKSINSNKAGAIIVVVSILTPIAFQFHPLVEGYPPHFTIMALLFSFNYIHGVMVLELVQLYSFVGLLVIAVPRFIFSFQVHRYYSGLSNLRQTRIMGVVAEVGIIMLSGFFDSMALITLISTGWYTSLMFPLPFPLIAFLIVHAARKPSYLIGIDAFTERT